MITRRALSLIILGFLLVPGLARALDPVFHDKAGLAIRGADPVAYFADSAYKQGAAEFSTKWMGSEWRFTSADHRDKFVANPTKYAPQYGGYCSWAVSRGYTASIDPRAWTVVNGKLYLNYSLDVQKKWLADRDNAIRKADANWPGLRDK